MSSILYAECTVDSRHTYDTSQWVQLTRYLSRIYCWHSKHQNWTSWYVISRSKIRAITNCSIIQYSLWSKCYWYPFADAVFRAPEIPVIPSKIKTLTPPKHAKQLEAQKKTQIRSYSSTIFLAGLIFLSIFGVTLILQFFGMLWHRWGTLRHIMATTIIDIVPGINQLKLARKDEADIIYEARKTAKEIARLELSAPEQDAASGMPVYLRHLRSSLIKFACIWNCPPPSTTGKSWFISGEKQFRMQGSWIKPYLMLSTVSSQPKFHRWAQGVLTLPIYSKAQI